MKRVLFAFVLIVMASYSGAIVQKVSDEIYLEAGIVDPTIPDDPYHRSPAAIPNVSLEGHTLFFTTPCDSYSLQLLDEYGSVVFFSVISTGTTSLALPSTLSGDYQIRLIEGYWYFYGWIHL